MATNTPPHFLSERTWKDPRYFFSFLFPIGILLWARGVPLAVHALFQQHPESLGFAREAAGTMLSIMLFFVSLWFVIAIIQAFFLEPRDKFIAHWVCFRDGAFELKGYYFRMAGFKASELESIEKYVADAHWFGPPGSWHYGTILTRNSRAKYNYSLKITLKDGRVFYLPGEMFQKEGPEALLSRLKPDADLLADKQPLSLDD